MALVSRLRINGGLLVLSVDGLPIARLALRKISSTRADLVLLDLHSDIRVSYEAIPAPDQEPPALCLSAT